MQVMWVRTQLSIGWRDLSVGALGCLFPRDRAKLAGKVESYFGDDGATMVAFSVRSGFDLLIQALQLDAGDEVIFSALNVRGMIKVALNAGLVSVPVDLDIAHMAPVLERLEAAITPRSKILVVAHLFGTKIDLDPIFEIAHRHGLIVVEDCAQAFTGRAYKGHAQADVAMFSFGPIKTATALGGALIRVRDSQLLARMREIQATYPVQKNASHFKRVVQFGVLKIIMTRRVLGFFYRFFEARDSSYEDEFAEWARNVAPQAKVKQRRYRPSSAMLALLARRLARFDVASLEARAAAGRRLSTLLADTVVMPAQANAYHDYWVFPILVDDPKAFAERLRAAGFDAADLPRSRTVAAPQNATHLEPHVASQALADLLVIPCYADMPVREIEREANVIRKIAAELGLSRTKAYANS